MPSRTQSRFCASLFAILAVVSLLPRGATAAGAISTFRLGNGMQVVVVEDHRAPVVTHMVWYRVGAADDPPGKGGLAHFLEHLMFKQTARLASGEFTRILTRLGARHNALTNHDTTSYFQRVAKEHLPRLMELEADRMTGLKLTDAEVATERDVVREERRSSVDASPLGKINEQMLAQLYMNHTYGRPVLGWAHEIEALSTADANAFYKRHYAPNNAILVVAGDVKPDEVRKLAEASYGRKTAGPARAERVRPREPDHIGARSVTLEDAQAGAAPIVLRYFHVPFAARTSPADIAALQLLGRILGGDDTSRLYRRLVLERKVAVQAGADFQAAHRDSTRMSLLAVASASAKPGDITQAFDEVIAELLAKGVSDDEVQRAKRVLDADAVYEEDNTEARARRIGEAITNGQTVADIEAEPMHRAAVTAGDIRRVAEAHLQPYRSATGTLLRPMAPAPAATAAAAKN